MNETQKSLLFIGVILVLFVIALDLLFSKRLTDELATARCNFQVESLTTEQAQGMPESRYNSEINVLEKKLHTVGIFKYLVLIVAALVFVAACFLRDKKRSPDFNNEWEDDEWEEEADK